MCNYSNIILYYIKIMEFEQINNKHNTEFTNKLLQNKNIFYEIYAACGNKFDRGCGSYLFDGQTYSYCNLMKNKNYYIIV